MRSSSSRSVQLLANADESPSRRPMMPPSLLTSAPTPQASRDPFQRNDVFRVSHYSHRVRSRVAHRASLAIATKHRINNLDNAAFSAAPIDVGTYTRNMNSSSSEGGTDRNTCTVSHNTNHSNMIPSSGTSWNSAGTTVAGCFETLMAHLRTVGPVPGPAQALLYANTDASKGGQDRKQSRHPRATACRSHG